MGRDVGGISGRPTSPPVHSAEETHSAERSESARNRTTANAPQAPQDHVERTRSSRIARHMQPARGLPQREFDQVYEKIQSLLSRSLANLNLAITDEDVENVHQLLERLPPDQYRRMLERMHRNGLLERYINEMEPEHRAAFLRQAAAKGYIQPARRPPVPQGWGNPPAPPQMYVNSARLPAPIRRAIHEHAVDALNAYNRAYSAYMRRYIDAVRNARTIADIRRLGPPAVYVYRQHPEAIEPGLTEQHPDYQRFRDDRASRWDSGIDRSLQLDLYQVVRERVAELTGRRSPGDLWLKIQAGMRFSALGTQGIQGEVRFSSERGVETQSADVQGVVAGDMQVTREVDNRGSTKDSVQVGAGGRSVQVRSDGTVEVTGRGAGGMHPFGFYNRRTAEFGGGVKIGVGDGQGPSAEVKIEVGMRGIRPEEARAAMDPNEVGFYDTPPELDRGIRWEDLPAERQQFYREILGWTPEEWNGELARRNQP